MHATGTSSSGLYLIAFVAEAYDGALIETALKMAAASEILHSTMLIAIVLSRA